MLQATKPPSFTTRTDALTWARDVADDPTSIFLDTETGGLGPDAEICDIAIVDREGRVLLNTLVKPNRPIPADSMRIHGISNEMVADAPTWESMWWSLAPILITAGHITAYNSPFDYRIVSQVCRMDGIQPPLDRWHCSLKAYAAFIGEPSAKGGGFRWWKLDEAASYFGIPRGGHRALSDAETCRKVVLAMAREEIQTS